MLTDRLTHTASYRESPLETRVLILKQPPRLAEYVGLLLLVSRERFSEGYENGLAG